MAVPAAAQQVRDLANVNGWRAYVAQGDGGLLCGMGTEANRLGRFFWIKVERLRGQLHGFVQVGDRSWNVRPEARGQIVIAIDRLVVGRAVGVAQVGRVVLVGVARHGRTLSPPCVSGWCAVDRCAVGRLP